MLYNLYRNAMFSLLLFWFYPYSAYSSATTIDELNLIFYSLLFTSLPTLVVGLMDQEVSQQVRPWV